MSSVITIVLKTILTRLPVGLRLASNTFFPYGEKESPFLDPSRNIGQRRLRPNVIPTMNTASMAGRQPPLPVRKPYIVLDTV